MQYATFALFLAAASAAPSKLSPAFSSDIISAIPSSIASAAKASVSSGISVFGGGAGGSAGGSASAGALLGGLISIPVLPIDMSSYITSGNGLDSLSATINGAVQQTNALAKGLLPISAGLKPNVPPTGANAAAIIQLLQNLAGLSDNFWKTATDAEKAVCSIATSITQQNVDAQQASLIAAINAQAQSITSLKATMDTVIATIVRLAGSFKNEEKAAIMSSISAIQESVTAVIDPVTKLSSGLQKAGLTAFGGVGNNLQASIASLSQTTAKLQVMSS